MNILIQNIRQLVTVASYGKKFKAGKEMRELGIFENAYVLIRNGIIKKISTEKITADDIDTLDATGKIALPGFVDSHTHTVFAESRENEFAMRAEGKTYQEIAQSGGGIFSTVNATRKATKKELLRRAENFLNNMMRYGTTTVEIKSGYGLDFDSEIKILDVINELQKYHYTTVVGTFLGAHAFPPEYREKPDEYIELLTKKMLPYVAEKKLVMFCDVFCEQNYFSLQQTKEILSVAQQHGLRSKIHADQLSAFGATELSAEMNAVSIDHLECVTEKGIAALKNSSSIATVLPGASFFLNHRYAPARKIIDANIPLAIATDFNPGSCMCYSMPLMLTIACTQMKVTPEEAITAATLNGAAALTLSDEIGSIEVGKKADIVLYDVQDYRYIPYHFGENYVWKVIKNGTVLEM